MPTIITSDARSREKPCLRCGYSLRKLFDSTHCPECGLSIWLSLSGNDGLEWSNPEWLRRLSLGSWILAVAQFIGLLSLVAVLVAAHSYLFVWQVRATLVVAAYVLLYHIGLLVVAKHEQRYPDRLKLLRTGCIVAALVGLLAGLGVVLVTVSSLGMHLRPAHHALYVVTLSARWVGLLTALMTLAYFRKLARRVPNATVGWICGILLFGPILSLLKYSPFIGLYMMFGIGRILDYLPWVYLPVSGAIFVWFALAFRKVSVSAEQSWASETRPVAEPSATPAR